MKLCSLLLGSISVYDAGQSSSIAIPSPSPIPNARPSDAGAVCANYTKGVQELHLVLSGKHLIVLEWMPWGVYNSSGWSGIDITLIDRVAEILNFTYQIKGLSWDAPVEKCDLLLCHWDLLPARIQNSTMLRGHVDNSVFLVANKPTVKQESFADHLETVFKPFTFGLWATVVGVMVSSGLLMFILKKDSESEDFDNQRAGSIMSFAACSFLSACSQVQHATPLTLHLGGFFF